MNTPNLTSHISHFTSNYAIIVAGGSGKRMQSAVPKQFLLLAGRPVLMQTIEAFYNSDAKPQIILVLPADYHSFWEQLCAEHSFAIPHQFINGGETRFHSVKAGLEIIDGNNNTLIAVHDAVRPLTSKFIIEESYRYAARFGNAIAAVKSRDSVRQVKCATTVSLLRDEIYLIQTPQTFQYHQLKTAYDQLYDAKFTDDASVVEQLGIAINLVEGSHQNIKITYPEDIAIAELLMSNMSL
jgi:2-C-methyl-D-erythritol 4-phosphate cytidylyltransferase